RAQDLRARTDRHTVLQGRMPFAVTSGPTAQGDAVVQHHVVADLRGLADHDAHAVVDEEPAADPCTRVDLDAGQPARELRAGAGRETQAAPPESMPDAVRPDRVQT